MSTMNLVTEKTTHAIDCDLGEDCTCMEKRRETLRLFLESEHASGFNLDEYDRAEGDVLEREEFSRYVMLDDCGTYAWLNFSDVLEWAGGDSFEACVAVDLDTGEIFFPRVTWTKSNKTVGPDRNALRDRRSRAKKGTRRHARR